MVGKLQDKRAWLNLQYSQISKITSMADWRFDKYQFEGNKEAVTKAFQALDSPLKTDRSQWKDANFLRGSPGWLGYIIIELLRNSLDDFLCRGTFRLTSDNIFQMKPGICGFKVEADSTWTPSVSLFQAIAESFGITLYYHSIGEWDDEIIFTNDEDGLVFPELKFTQ